MSQSSQAARKGLGVDSKSRHYSVLYDVGNDFSTYVTTIFLPITPLIHKSVLFHRHALRQVARLIGYLGSE